MRLMTFEEISAWFEANSAILLTAAAVATIVMLVVLIRWTIKGRHLPSVIRVVGPLLGIAWNAEATYEVLRRALNVPPVVAGLGFVVFEVLMLGAAIEAERHFKRRVDAKDPNPTLGPAKFFVFTIAFLTATAASFNSNGNPAVIIFRYGVAVAVAWYWALKFMRDHTGAARRTTWALSPRRVLVRWGLIDPTDADLSQVHHERQIRIMVTLARRIFHGAQWLRPWRESRFAKAAELATTDMMAEVVARITRADMALELANPATTAEKLAELARQADARQKALLTADTRRIDPPPDRRIPPDQRRPDQVPDDPADPADEPNSSAPSGAGIDLWAKRQGDIKLVDKHIPDWLTRDKDLSAGDVLKALVAAHNAGEREKPTVGKDIQLEIAKAMNECRHNRVLAERHFPDPGNAQPGPDQFDTAEFEQLLRQQEVPTP